MPLVVLAPLDPPFTLAVYVVLAANNLDGLRVARVHGLLQVTEADTGVEVPFLPGGGVASVPHRSQRSSSHALPNSTRSKRTSRVLSVSRARKCSSGGLVF